MDEDYRLELGLILFNFGDEDCNINMGDKIAQLIFEKINTPAIVETNSLEETGRGDKGFSSTGINSVEQQIISQSPDQKSESDQSSKPKTDQINSEVQSADSAQDKKYMKQFKNEPIPHVNV